MIGTIRGTIRRGAERLAVAGIQTARRDAELLLLHVLGRNSAWLFGREDEPLDEQEQAGFDRLIERRLTREPVSHLLGLRGFWTHEFEVSRDVLDPRPDTETLIEAVLEVVTERAAPMRLLDLGTGSGCIALTLLGELPAAQAVAVDLSPNALAVAGRNALRLGYSDRIEFVESDWATAVSGPFDIVVANPPYIRSGDIAGLMPEVARHEPHLALDGGADGLVAYRSIVADLSRLVRPGALVAMEVGAGQAAAVSALLDGAGVSPVRRRADLGGVDRCLWGLYRSKKPFVAGAMAG